MEFQARELFLIDVMNDFHIMFCKAPAARIVSLDHLVLTVKSIPKTIKWYETNLGMLAESFNSTANPETTKYSLKFGTQKINLHQLGKVSSSRIFVTSLNI